MLEIKGVSKSFPGVKALQNISVSFNDGEIHALLGENGAGKSTLMKIICGIYKADEGKVFLDGEELKLSGYGDSVRHHISMVHQEIQMIPESSIAENIVNDKISKFTKCGFVNWKEINSFAKKYMDEVGLDFPPEKKVRFLSAAHKQQIQIAKALSADAKVLLLDEPTSSLTPHEANVLFDLVRKLRDKGLVIIFVSHKLEEVQMIADRVTVFRDGQLVGTDAINNMDNAKIIRMMIGRDFVYEYRGRLDAYDNEVVLKAENITSYIHGFSGMNFLHNIFPDFRTGITAAHGLWNLMPYPNTTNIIRRKAHKPAVLVFVCGTRFTTCIDISQRCSRACTASDNTGEHILHNISGFFAHSAFGLHLVFQYNFSVCINNLSISYRLVILSLIHKCSICCSHFFYRYAVSKSAKSHRK